ncbi:MAG: FapA family protein [Planctomycetota bacterium]|nr:FapA family protein [Planctomycetota bacterium]
MTSSGDITIRISHDATEACLLVPPGCDRALLSPSSLLMLVQQAGVALTPQVRQAIGAIRPDTAQASPIVIARAIPPTPGTNGRLEWAEGYAPDAPPSTPESGSGSVDHHAGRRYLHVRAGDVVGTLHPPTEGIDGCDVRGNAIRATPGRAAAVRLHASLSVDPDGRVIAQREGVLTLRDGEVEVSQALEINGPVDFSSGNIDFAGDVYISGGVRAGFRVKAGRALRVGGLAEASAIECAGDFDAPGGMAGDGRGTLEVGGTARVAYLDAVSGTIKGDLFVERELIACRLAVGGSVRSPAGTVLGGTLALASSLDVRVLGSEAGTPTVVRLGDLPMDRAALAGAMRRVTAARARLARCTEEELMLRVNPRPCAAEKERLTEVAYELSEIRRAIVAAEADLAQLEALYRGRPRPSIVVHHTIHAGVSLHVDASIAVFSRAVRGPLHIETDASGALLCRIGSGPSRPLADLARVTTLPAPAATPESPSTARLAA